MDRLPEGTVTFLFTDIEGSTQRWEARAGAMRRASARHDEIVRDAVATFGGVIFNSVGDAFYAVFADALDAITAAVAAQRALAAEAWSDYGVTPADLRVRMGVHTGVAELRDGLYHGPPLNRTGRLTAAGHGGQVLLTLAAEQLVRDRLPADCELRDLGVHRLRDLHYTEHIFQVIAPGMLVVTAPLVTAEQVAADEPPQHDAHSLATICPYRGLRAFREEDEPFFFGRETFSTRLVAGVRADPVAAVIGPSGCGKSSVVFAGLVPQLRGRAGNGHGMARDPRWTILSLRPGHRPFHALAGALVPHLEGPLDETDLVIKTGQLAGALRRGEVEIGDVLVRVGDRQPDLAVPLLIADQFEELYTLCPDESERRAFQDALFEATLNAKGAPPMKLALTLRADFMGQALAYRSFADAVQGHNIVLGPMNREELARAIARPAELQGCAFEPGLVERILDDVSQRTGALPLLEFAMAELWQRQEGGWLTHAGYEAIGRVGGAIAQHADAVYERLDDAQRATARRVFVQLVKPGEGTEDSRRLATRDDLGDHWDLVHVLADARLVVANRDADNRETVELVHEALIQSWQRLRQWLNADRRFRQWQERLRFSLGQWERSNHDPDALLRGATLSRAEEWVAARGGELAATERAFVAASAAERDRQEAEREMRRQREIDAARRAADAERRRAAVQTVAARGLGLLSVGLIVAVIVAGFFWRNATQATQEAVVQQLAAMARTVSLEGQPRRGLLLALEAQQRDTGRSGSVSAEARESLRFALSRVQGHKVDAVDAPLTASAVSPGGHWLATGDVKGRVRLSTIAADGTLARQRDLGPLAAEVVGLAFDGRDGRLFGVDKEGTVRVWDLAAQKPDGTVVDRLVGPACAMQVDPTGRWLVVGGKNQELRLWDLAASGQLGAQRSRISYVDGESLVCALAFAPAGDQLAAGDSEDRIKIWRLDAPDIAGSWIAVALHTSDVKDLAYSPDGEWLLSGGGDGNAYLIRRSTLEGVPAGTALDATGIEAGALYSLTGHDNDVTAVVIAPDATWFGTADMAGTVRVWQLAGGSPIGPRMIERFRTPVSELVATPDSRHLVAVSGDAEIGVWQMPPDAGRLRGYILTGHDGRVNTLDLVRNGDWMFTGSENGSVLRWDVGTGVSGIEPLILRGHADNVATIAVLAEGRQFASASWDGTVRIWPSEAVLGGLPFAPIALPGHTDRATAVIAAPERLGEPACSVVTGDGVGAVRLWSFCADPRHPESIPLLAGLDDERVSALATSADGRWLVAGDGGNRLWVWDLARPDDLQPPIELPSEQGTPNVIRFVDAGGALLSASGNGTVEEWSLDAPRPRLVRTFRQPGASGNVRALAYDDASQTLLVGNTNGQADVWRRSGQAGASTSLPWDGGRIRAVALAANGRTALVAGESPYVRVWPDWTRREQSQALLVSVEGANDIALGPDDQFLAVAGADGVVYTWTRDAAGGYGQRVALQGHQASVTGLRILAGPAAGDLRLISYDQAGEIRLWDLDQAALLERACEAAGRNLTPDEEWPQYFPDEPWRPTCPGLE